MTPTLKLLRELIALPSVNPAFLPAGHARAGERKVAEFLAATAAKEGLEIEFQEVTKGRANLPTGRRQPAYPMSPHRASPASQPPGKFAPAPS